MRGKCEEDGATRDTRLFLNGCSTICFSKQQVKDALISASSVLRFNCGYDHLMAVFRQSHSRVDQFPEGDQQGISDR
jgi:hypothetical protein